MHAPPPPSFKDGAVPKSSHLNLLGINTGNSLDAADLVLTRFGLDGSIEDLDALSVPMPNLLAEDLRNFRKVIIGLDGDMDKARTTYPELEALVDRYTTFVSNAIKEICAKPKTLPLAIDAIGLHGQTCAHKPFSVAGDRSQTYTLQLAHGQLLADLTDMPVIFDFRSDDLINGGEGAPLAPIHHKHLGEHLKLKGHFPVCFLNAGNTGNISVITSSKTNPQEIAVFGWDTGPFNEYPDKLMRLEKNQNFDRDGHFGLQGKVNLALLRLLFLNGAVNSKGENFFLQAPPKSSDPQWYKFLPELLGEQGIDSREPISFEDRIRTCEYFAAYIFFYSLKWIKEEYFTPNIFALCGGGWNNPVARQGFEMLVGTDEVESILPEHRQIFQQIRQVLKSQPDRAEIELADRFGFSGQFMEARLFADAAFRRIKGEAFTQPSVTGCRTNTVLGIIRFPKSKGKIISSNLASWLNEFKSDSLTLDQPQIFDERWSRAASGWTERCRAATKLADKDQNSAAHRI